MKRHQKRAANAAASSPSKLSLVVLLVSAVAVLTAVLAGAGLLGLGVERGLPFWLSAAVAVTMLLLPSFGLRTVLAPMRSSSTLALFLWSLGLLLCLPLYVGDFAGSVRLGLEVALKPAGETLAEEAGRLGHRVARSLSDRGRTQLPLAQELPVVGQADVEVTAASPVEEASVPALDAPELPRDEGLVTLGVDGEGSSLKVKVLVESNGSPRELSLLFDTGATLTTLDRGTLRELGVPIPDDAPEVTLQTAAGQVESSVVLLDRLWLGHVPIDHVAVAVCDACAQKEVRGLLGLNVTGLFDVTLNSGQQELELRPADLEGDRRLDVKHFVALDAKVTMWRLGRVEVEVEATNLSEVAISELVVELICGDRSFAVQVDNVPAAGSADTELELPRGTNCRTYQVVLRSARW